MKDIPVFTSEYGAASLVLREIPYRQRAYITILDSLEPAKLLEECVGFCRACGAETVFATGANELQRYPLASSIVEMWRPKAGLEGTDALLVPITKESVGQWRKICNRRMADVAIAAFFTAQDEKTLLNDADAYFVEKDGVLVGIGKASGDTIHAIASLIPGMGETALRALATALTGEHIRLTVADSNEKAIGLYTRLGFQQTKDLSRWYKVFPQV